MLEMTELVRDESQLIGVATKVLTELSDYQVFTLQGDLGAGKTRLVQAFVKALDSDDDTSSPTFSIVNEYRTQSGKAIFHMDLYRLEEEEELINIGFTEYLSKENYCFIEWPALAVPYLDKYVEVTIEILEGNSRKITFQAKDQ